MGLESWTVSASARQSSELMPAAEVGRPSEDDRPANRSPATRATKPLLAMQHQRLRRIAVAVCFPHDRLAQQSSHGGEKRSRFVGCDPVEGPLGMDARLVEHLVCIEVADAGDDLLRHQERLERTSSPPDQPLEASERESPVERIDAEEV